MQRHKSLWYKFIALALALVLIVPILAACGNKESKTPTATPTLTPTLIAPTSSPTPAATSTSTPTPTFTVTPNRMVPTSVKGEFEFSPELGPATTYAEHLGNQIPVILVHGSGSDLRVDTLNYWRWWCGDQYFNSTENSAKFKVYRYVYDSSRHISENGSDFAQFITKYPEFQGRKIVIMAHSMGGLVARYALNVSADLRTMTVKLLTLGTPHLGTPIADPTWLCQTPGLENSVPVIESFFGGSTGNFDLAWYNPNDMPAGPGCSATLHYDSQLLQDSINIPFTGSKEMQETSGDNKIIAFGGYMKSGISIQGLRNLADHLKLGAANVVMKRMQKKDGYSFNKNDGLVPLESALCETHPGIESINITDQYGVELDHVSYLDDQKVMDIIMQRLLEEVQAVNLNS
jgi:pimeloyl-ACP methyl ester carboxylesterase